MEGSPFLPLSDELHIEQVTVSAHELLVSVISSSPTACCPLCGVQAWHVTLLLTVRKFFCPNPNCLRKIFAEQFPDLVPSYARLTTRLREALVALGFATSGEVASRLAPRLGMQVAPTTLLRRVRAVPLASSGPVRVLGVDDWAWKKGQTYGTILVDLEKHQVIELLPDRSQETVERWLRTHPEIEIVSRDRGGDYAAAARRGAPQAQQVADRFHVVKNLREAIRDLMERKQSCLLEAPEDERADGVPSTAQGRAKGIKVLEVEPEGGQEKRYRIMSPYLRQSARQTTYEAVRTQVRRDNRSARYQAVRMLHQQGFSLREISRRLKISRQTVRRFVRAESLPERNKAPHKASLLDPYKPYLLKRWQQGCWNGAQLFAESRARGYPGSAPLLRRFLRELRTQQQVAGETNALALDAEGTRIELPVSPSPKPIIKHRMAPTLASWLFVSRPTKLDEKQRRQVEDLRAAHPDLETAYLLSKEGSKWVV